MMSEITNDQIPVSTAEVNMAAPIQSDKISDRVDNDSVGSVELVSTPVSKKRNLSEPDSDISVPVSVKKPRLNLNASGANQFDGQIDNATVCAMFQSLSEQMTQLYGDLSNRISNIEANLEMKLTQKLKSAVQSEFEGVRSEIKVQISDVRTEVNNKVNEMKKSYANAVRNQPGVDMAGKGKTFVIKNLSADASEKNDPNVLIRNVNTLVQSGLKLNTFHAHKAERKQTKGKSPGIILVTAESADQKDEVMKNKRKLKNVKKYERVYIEDDMSDEARKASSNMRTILKELRCERDYRMVNGRLVRNDKVRSDDGRVAQNRYNNQGWR